MQTTTTLTVIHDNGDGFVIDYTTPAFAQAFRTNVAKFESSGSEPDVAFRHALQHTAYQVVTGEVD